jgi:hypothetical protein
VHVPNLALGAHETDAVDAAIALAQGFGFDRTSAIPPLRHLHRLIQRHAPWFDVVLLARPLLDQLLRAAHGRQDGESKKSKQH